MRIISTFHDYYDAIQAQGQDLDLIYLRTAKEIKLTEWPFPICQSCHYSTRNLHFSEWIIGFCGKIYPLLQVELRTLLTGRRADEPPEVVCFSAADVDAYAEKYLTKKQLERYYAKKRSRLRRDWHYAHHHYVVDEFFEECARRQNEFSQIFNEHRVPIFTAKYKRDPELTLNAELKPFEFYRLFDTFTAFQEIQMFLGAIAVPLKPIPDIPDKIMAEAKGFDKWSFRKEPTKKQPRVTE